MEKALYIIILIIYLIISYILFNIGMFFLLRKEHRSKYTAFIPIINLYQYTKTCELPFIVVLVPVANLIMLFLSPIKLAQLYKCNIFETIFGLLFPMLFLNYIAFSDMTNRRIVEKNEYMPTQEKVDELDRKLIAISEGKKVKEEKEYIFFRKKKIKSYNQKSETTEEMLDDIEAKVKKQNEIEENSPQLEIYEEIELIEDKPKHKETIEEIENFDEINPDLNIDSVDDIDKIEQDVITEEKQDTGIDKNEYEDYKAVGPSSTAIAFGGEDKKEDKTHATHDELKCPRCGCSLVGAINNTCPGCGQKISQ